MRSRTMRAMLVAVALTLAIPVGATAAPGDVKSVDLTLLGKSSLPSLGHDGQTKPRGQNGDVAVIGDTAFVAGGALFHGARSTPGRICTDYGGVKVVDIKNPANPTMIGQINVEDTKGVLTGAAGNPRIGLKLQNVSSSVSSLDVIDHPVTGKKILAIATQRCEQSFFNGARIEFWDVSNPAGPSHVGNFDPETIINPACSPGPPVSCPPGVTPATGAWGIFEEVRMFTRKNGPGGATKVYAVATTPFSIGNAHDASFAGDFRLLDVTDPANPSQVATFPKANIGQSTNNGCRTFQSGRSAAPTPDGSHAILSWYDGAQPANAPLSPTGLGGPDSAALFNLDLDNLPQPVAGSNPVAFSPNPPTWGYPFGTDGGETPGGAVEGNAADVQPFTATGGKLMSFVSEEDADPAITRATIDGPPEVDYTGRACETLFANKLYLRPGQRFEGDYAFVGRGCPASPTNGTTNRAADPYLEDPNGKIAVFDSGGGTFDGCSFGDKIRRASAAGATGVVGNLGGDFLNLFIPGPNGGFPAIPSVGLQATGWDRLAGAVPNRVLTGVTVPANYVRSSTTNVLVRPLATAITAATNASPIVLTAANHGLVTGQRVAVRGVRGNTAANGNFTVTVSGNSVTLDGSSGNGAFTPGGGFIYACPPGQPNCTAPDTRTDIARFRQVADSTDRTARVQMNPTFVTTTADAPAGATSIPVAPLPASGLPGSTVLRFSNGAFATVSAAASAGATTISVNALARPIPSGSVGSVLARVTAGQSYRAGGLFEVQTRTAGAFTASIRWYDAAGAEIGSDAITPAGGLDAVSPRTLRTATATAPAGAVRAGLRTEWTGATAEGTAFADSLFLRPSTTQIQLLDQKGEWGAQRIIDFSVAKPTEVGTFRSPRSLLWPPPNDGVYEPSVARMLSGTQLAFTGWMSDGLQVVDVADPTKPRLVGSFVPPDTPDPSAQAGAGPTDREGETGSLLRGKSWPDRALVTSLEVVSKGPDEALVALSDINAGLYLVRAKINREVAPTPTVTATPTATTTPPQPIARCGRLTLVRRNASRSRTRVDTRVRLPCAGDLDATAKTKIRVRGKSRTARLKAKIVRLSGANRAIRISLGARKIRRQLRRAGRLTITIRAEFIPDIFSDASLPSRRTIKVVVRESS